MARRWPTAALAAAILTFLPGTAPAEVIYCDDFEEEGSYVKSGIRARWSADRTDRAPGAQGRRADRFRGQFGNETVSLTLEDLPAHTQVSVAFDLYILRSWDGNNDELYKKGYRLGPDRWRLAVGGGGPTLLDTSFSNHETGGGISPYSEWQAYPGPFGAWSVAALTGADEVNTLGYFHPLLTDVPMDSIYRMSFTFDSSDRFLEFLFTGLPDQDLDDESWGLDNVVVSIVAAQVATTAPEPSGMVLLGLGALALTGYRWRRRRQAG